MIVDIHKPDTSTLVTTGHFYFGWTSRPNTLDKDVSHADHSALA